MASFEYCKLPSCLFIPDTWGLIGSERTLLKEDDSGDMNELNGTQASRLIYGRISQVKVEEKT